MVDILDIIEIGGKRYKIVGAGFDPNAPVQDYWKARLIDEKGNVIYGEGTSIRIPKTQGAQ